MSDLVSRVLAAIEDAEQNAQAVTHMHWIFPKTSRMNGRTVLAEFFERNGPAAVLRRCAADRKLLERGGPFCSCYEYGPPTNPNTGQSIPHHYDCSSYETASLLAGVYGISIEEETTQ